MGFPNSVYNQVVKLPHQKGHRITGGLSVVNRTGRGPVSHVWVPKEILQDPEKRAQHRFRADWVAIREVDITRQHANHMNFDMDVESGHLSTWAHSYMTDDGYRLVVVTIGTYEQPMVESDELTLFDDELRERIESLASIIWQLERGESLSEELAKQLWFKGWKNEFLFPSVGVDLGGLDLFYQHKNWEGANLTKKYHHELMCQFMDLVANARKESFHSDQVMLGIQIPEFGKKHQKMYSPHAENRTWTFNSFLADVFGKFDMWAVDSSGIQPTVIHLPTYHQRKKAQSAPGKLLSFSADRRDSQNAAYHLKLG